MTTTDYISLFQVKKLTRIIGEPSYFTLKQLQNECKANDQKFHTTLLGGGHHQYLGLVMNPAQYARLSAIPFVRPNNPGPLVPNGTAAQIAAQKSAHEEAKRLYEECYAIERAMQDQILEAIENNYLKTSSTETLKQLQ